MACPERAANEERLAWERMATRSTREWWRDGWERARVGVDFDDGTPCFVVSAAVDALVARDD